MTTVSAIIVNYNGGSDLGAAVDSLLSQSRPPDEIIVVDNASTDQSIAQLSTAGCVRVVQSGSNLGFTGGNNLGMQHASGDYIALLNSDAAADRDWIAQLVATLDGNPDAAAAMGKILFAWDRARFDQAGALFNDVGNYWGRGFHEVDEGQYDLAGEVAGVTGCAMILRRAALRGAPLFDDDIFMYGEELDLTIRLRAAGFRLLYEPRAVVFHKGMESVRRLTGQARLFQQFHSNRNRAKLLAKYYPLPILFGSMHLVVGSFLYWNLKFLRLAGARYALRAIREQVRYAIRGLRERRTLPSTWTEWMTRQTLREILRQKRTMEQVA